MATNMNPIQKLQSQIDDGMVLWRERLAEAADVAQSVRHETIACLTINVTISSPWALTSALMGTQEPFWLWTPPGADDVTLAIGQCVVHEVWDGGAFDSVRTAWKAMDERIVCSPSDKPRFMCGFAFSPEGTSSPWWAWPNASLVLPEFLFEIDETGTGTLTLSASVSDVGEIEERAQTTLRQLRQWMQGALAPTVTVAGSSVMPARSSGMAAGSADEATPMPHVNYEPDRMHWHEQIDTITRKIRDGRCEKVVMARRMTVNQSAEDLGKILSSLRTTYPDSFLFAVRRGNACFVGASPERLVAKFGESVCIDCLAGTAPRGKTDIEDAELGTRLLGSQKDRHEHDVVVRYITTAVRDVLADISVPQTPQLKKLANVQHLFSPLTGRLQSDATILDLIQRLHPTPAVAGMPREVALEFIRQFETIDRGWYAAPVGWVNRDGDGEFAVALRSALLSQGEAHIFAGAGIMADSTPDSEWNETEWKMRPVMQALAALLEEGASTHE